MARESALLRKRITWDHSQILSSPVTDLYEPYQEAIHPVIPAPGPDKILEVYEAQLSFERYADYTVGAWDSYISFGPPNDEEQLGGWSCLDRLLSKCRDTLMIFSNDSGRYYLPGDNTDYNDNSPKEYRNLHCYRNTGLYLIIGNWENDDYIAAPLTGGDERNKLHIEVLYRIKDLNF